MSKLIAIVGSGVAAVAVGRRLLQKNTSAKLLVFEAGDDFLPGKPQSRYRSWVDFVMSKNAPTKQYEDKTTDAEINPDGPFDLVGGRLIVKGGSTNHWGGWCPRMKPEDFRLGDVRPGSLNWQISYNDLIDYYWNAEHFLGVCGDSTTKSVPRNGREYKHKPVPYTALDGLLIPTLKAMGDNSFEPLPIARSGEKCQTSGTCRFCPMGARYEAAADLDQLAGDFPGRVEIRTNAPVATVVMKSKKTASAIQFFDKGTGGLKTIDVDSVVVAAGTIESAKVLLASKSAFWPSGLGNDTGHVGRHLITHPLIRAFARVPNNTARLEQELDFPTMASRIYDTPEFQRTGKMYFVRDGKYIVAKPADRLVLQDEPAAINADIIGKTRLELRALIEAFPADENQVSLLSGSTASGLPRSKIVYREHVDTLTARATHLDRLQRLLYKAGLEPTDPAEPSRSRSDHSTGTCRMSDTAAVGVVDKNLRIHDTDNAFVASNAVFPNAGAVNPTLTLVALCLRLGDYLAT